MAQRGSQRPQVLDAVERRKIGVHSVEPTSLVLRSVLADIFQNEVLHARRRCVATGGPYLGPRRLEHRGSPVGDGHLVSSARHEDAVFTRASTELEESTSGWKK